MRSRIVVCLSFFLVSLAIAPPAPAEEPFASPVPGAPRIVLGYGDEYAQGGAGRVHRGADLAAGGGAAVRSCTSGKVTFAGLVPATGEASRTVAVTVSRDDGVKTTYMPLISAGVKAGQRVEAGDELGALAADGDASSPSPHLHLSVRRGDAYLDPASFLAPAPPPSVTEPAPGESPAPAPKAHPAPVPAAAPAASPAPAPAGAPQAAASHAAKASGAGAAAAAPHAAGSPAPRASAAAPPSRGAAGAPRAAHVPNAAPAVRAAAAASAAASKAAPAASSSALACLGRAYGGARRIVTALAELLVASALLWPVWRSVTRPLEPSAAVVPARVRE